MQGNKTAFYEAVPDNVKVGVVLIMCFSLGVSACFRFGEYLTLTERSKDNPSHSKNIWNMLGWMQHSFGEHKGKFSSEPRWWYIRLHRGKKCPDYKFSTRRFGLHFQWFVPFSFATASVILSIITTYIFYKYLNIKVTNIKIMIPLILFLFLKIVWCFVYIFVNFETTYRGVSIQTAKNGQVIKVTPCFNGRISLNDDFLQPEPATKIIEKFIATASYLWLSIAFCEFLVNCIILRSGKKYLNSKSTKEIEMVKR